ncbi:hypothetical protein SPHINGO391_450133 [Sphingomonas aurantiaca]|uniref:Uncharacterized protein n=1 Tax=Sphingomonas aurantiaca TaxID=185949 RepID=A0A5E7ZG97_9SPHN|nr:hypothetical protein SPHINGO391_450133 [Sphingomonas aurantiaca]
MLRHEGSPSVEMRMSVTEVDPIIELMKRLRRAAQTSTGKLHLSNKAARVLLRHNIYQILARMEAEEMRKACVNAIANDNNLGSLALAAARHRNLEHLLARKASRRWRRRHEAQGYDCPRR